MHVVRAVIWNKRIQLNMKVSKVIWSGTNMGVIARDLSYRIPIVSCAPDILIASSKMFSFVVSMVTIAEYEEDQVSTTCISCQLDP